jgi:hypothetical protein
MNSIKYPHPFPEDFDVTSKQYISCVGTFKDKRWQRIRELWEYSQTHPGIKRSFFIEVTRSSLLSAGAGATVGFISSATRTFLFSRYWIVNVLAYTLSAAGVAAIRHGRAKITIMTESDTSFLEWKVSAIKEHILPELEGWLVEDEVLKHGVCPLSSMLSTDPVLCQAKDEQGRLLWGQNGEPILHNHNPYERSEIERWLETGNKICPMTREPLSRGELKFVKTYRGDILKRIREIRKDQEQPLSKNVIAGLEAYRNGIVAEARLSLVNWRDTVQELYEKHSIDREEYDSQITEIGNRKADLSYVSKDY